MENLEKMLNNYNSNNTIKKVGQSNLSALKELFFECDKECVTDFLKFGTFEYIKENDNKENKKPNLFFLIFNNKTLIGFLNINFSKIKDKRANIFIYIDKKYRKNGYATKLFNNAKTTLFNNYNIVKIDCALVVYKDHNNFLNQLGFTKEVEKREAILNDGKYFNVATFGINNITDYKE